MESWKDDDDSGVAVQIVEGYTLYDDILKKSLQMKLEGFTNNKRVETGVVFDI